MTEVNLGHGQCLLSAGFFQHIFPFILHNCMYFANYTIPKAVSVIRIGMLGMLPMISI